MYNVVTQMGFGYSLMQKKKQIWFSPRKRLIPLDYKDIIENNSVPFKDELMDNCLASLQNNASIRKSMSTSD